uniref:Uncharacterized protein n=1 Tax=Rhizophora mucronata TaxID=61149 RepID=A0A2P2PTZ3_RHIMU
MKLITFLSVHAKQNFPQLSDSIDCFFNLSPTYIHSYKQICKLLLFLI